MRKKERKKERKRERERQKVEVNSKERRSVFVVL